jgi:sarcosine oxidase subunit beta
MAESYDAIVIGAGVIGCCTSFELAKAGYRVLTVDRNPSAGYGSTSASCAIIRTYYSVIDSCALAYEGWFHWKDWAAYIGGEDPRGMIEYRDVGCLVTKTEQNGELKSVLAMMDEIGCPYEHLTPDAMKARLPFLDLRRYGPAKAAEDPDFGAPTGDAIPGGVFFPRGGYVNDPGLAARNAEFAARREGADFLFNADVADIRQANGRIAGITLADGRRFDAPVVVNVAGPHSSKINRMAGQHDAMRMKTRALRHEVAHAPAPPGFDFGRDGCVTSDSDIATYSRPETGNHVLIGSEDPECDSRDWVDPDDYNPDLTDQARLQAMRMAQRFEGLAIPNRIGGVVGLYDVTDDWIPIYDRTDLDGFYVAIGTSGNQFKNAPVAGRMMAELITACENGHDHDSDPVTITYGNIGRTHSIGFFSRNREVNPDSSFSVLG